jgi:hypothetical protein
MSIVEEHAVILGALFAGIGTIVGLILRRDTPRDRGKRGNDEPPE